MSSTPRVSVVRYGGFKLTSGIGFWVSGILILLSLRFGLFPFWYERLTGEEYWVMSFVTTFGIALSLIGHNLAHFVVAKWLGARVTSARLFLFGDLTFSKEAETADREWKIELAGPVFNLLVGVVLYAIAYYGDTHGIGYTTVGVLFHLGAANFTIALLNLIPIFPLDGGKIFRFELSQRMHNFALANDVVTVGGMLLAAFITFAGILFILKHHFLIGGWIAVMGLVLGYAARLARVRGHSKGNSK